MNAGVPPDAGTKSVNGMTVTVPVPASPAVIVFEGVKLETVTKNDELHCEVTVWDTATELEPL